MVPIRKARRAAGVLAARLQTADIRYELSGPIRSGKAEIPYVLLVVKRPMYRVFAQFEGLTFKKLKVNYRYKGDTSFVFEGVTFWVAAVSEESWGTATIHRGPIKFAALVAERAAQLGYKFSQRGLIFNDEIVAGRYEAQIYHVLDMPYVKYQDRFDPAKIKALRARLFGKGDS